MIVFFLLSMVSLATLDCHPTDTNYAPTVSINITSNLTSDQDNQRTTPTIDRNDLNNSMIPSVAALSDSIEAFDSTNETSEQFEGLFRDLMVFDLFSTTGLLSPTTRPTARPTESFEPSISTSSKPGTFPTRSPTTSPTALDKFKSYSYKDVNKPLFFAAAAFACVGLIISIILLMVYRKKLQQDSWRGTIMETVKEMSLTQKIFCLFCNVFDVISDFMFAIDLLLHYQNQTIHLFGWICFITGIFGVILFCVKLLLMRKVLHRIAKLRKERNDLYLIKRNQKDPEIETKTQEIRARQKAIITIDLLTASLEDIPQVTISLLMSLFTGFQNAFALVSLAFSLFSIFWCPVAILVKCCGCDDDPLPDVEETDHLTEPGNVTEIQHILNNSNNLPNGWKVMYTNDGRIYYQNDLLQITQWGKPMNDATTVLNPSEGAMQHIQKIP